MVTKETFTNDDILAIAWVYFKEVFKKLREFPRMYNEFSGEMQWIKHAAMITKENGWCYIVPLGINKDYDPINPLQYDHEDGLLHWSRQSVGDVIYYNEDWTIFDAVANYNTMNMGKVSMKLLY